MSGTRSIKLYFDYISPYAYLGWVRTQGLRHSHLVQVQPIPVLFAGLLNRWGGVGPAEITPKRAFVYKDVFRIAKSLGLKLGFPPSHPFNPLLPLRVTVAIMEKDDPHLLKSAVASIFEACWMRSQDVTNEEVLLQVLRSVRGLNAEDALARAHTQPVKDTLRGLTEAAADAGVFGVPTFVVDDELFWGQDQVPFILDKLDGKDPFRGVDIDEIIRRPIAASRKIRTM